MAIEAIELEVDCNSDIVTLFVDGKEVYNLKVYYPTKFIDLLSEIFNRLQNNDGTINNISITKIDEYTKKTIEEW